MKMAASEKKIVIKWLSRLPLRLPYFLYVFLKDQFYRYILTFFLSFCLYSRYRLFICCICIADIVYLFVEMKKHGFTM